MAHLALSLKDDLSHTNDAEKAREKRSKTSHRTYQSGGVLYSQEARSIRDKRDDDEVAKARLGYERAKRKREKEENQEWLDLIKAVIKQRRVLGKRWKAEEKERKQKT
jgi:hypothetical protein